MRLKASAFLLLAAIATPASAERLPAPGGLIRVALPEDSREAFIEAHTQVALLEPTPSDPRERRTRPALDSRGRTSSVIEVLEQTAPDRWRLTARPGLENVVMASVRRCLAPDGPWPGRALAAAGRSLMLTVEGREGTLVADGPLGPLPELLLGCSIPAEELGGAFTVHPRRQHLLTATEPGPGESALLGSMELVPNERRADLRPGGTLLGGDTELTSPTPDVILLVPSEEARRDDPLGLETSAARGRFLNLLQPDLLAEVFLDGRGGRPVGILPPGLGPSRPLPRSEAQPAPATPMPELPSGAPSVVLNNDGGALVEAVSERLTALLRAAGRRVHADGPSLTVARWRPATLDPALAMLTLAAEHPELSAADAPGLLDADSSVRIAAAAALEMRWIDEVRVVPLLNADRWFVVAPSVRGVRLRSDGLPMLHDAHRADEL